MIELGRLCVKIAGRDAGKKCIVIDILDDNYVLIDGETRRRKCNITHLEPLDNVIKIKKKTSHEDVKSEFKKLGLKVLETKSKPKTERQKRKRSEKKTVKQEPKEAKKEKKPKKEVKKNKK